MCQQPLLAVVVVPACSRDTRGITVNPCTFLSVVIGCPENSGAYLSPIHGKQLKCSTKTVCPSGFFCSHTDGEGSGTCCSKDPLLSEITVIFETPERVLGFGNACLFHLLVVLFLVLKWRDKYTEPRIELKFSLKTHSLGIGVYYK